MSDSARIPAAFVDAPQAAECIARRHGLDIEQAREMVTDGVQLGRIPARLFDRGNPRPAALGELHAELIWSTGLTPILLGPIEADGAHQLNIIRPTIEISLADALAYAAAALGAAPQAQPPALAPARDRGGRPAEHDWRAATRQVLLRVREYGWPATKSELVAELLDWFARRTSEPPDESTVRRFVGAIWPDDGAECELEPCQ